MDLDISHSFMSDTPTQQEMAWKLEKWCRSFKPSMMTSSNGNIFRVTGPVWGEFTGHRWIPLKKASDMELWWFFFICAWTNSWVNNRDAGDLRHHRAHYDAAIVFNYFFSIIFSMKRINSFFTGAKWWMVTLEKYSTTETSDIFFCFKNFRLILFYNRDQH